MVACSCIHQLPCTEGRTQEMLLSAFRTLATTYHTPPGVMTPVLRMPWRAETRGAQAGMQKCMSCNMQARAPCKRAQGNKMHLTAQQTR